MSVSSGSAGRRRAAASLGPGRPGGLAYRITKHVEVHELGDVPVPAAGVLPLESVTEVGRLLRDDRALLRRGFALPDLPDKLPCVVVVVDERRGGKRRKRVLGSGAVDRGRRLAERARSPQPGRHVARLARPRQRLAKEVTFAPLVSPAEAR